MLVHFVFWLYLVCFPPVSYLFFKCIPRWINWKNIMASDYVSFYISFANLHTQNYLVSLWLNLLPCLKQKERLTSALCIIRQFQKHIFVTPLQVWKVCSIKVKCGWFITCFTTSMVHKQDLTSKSYVILMLRHDNQPVFKIRLIISNCLFNLAVKHSPDKRRANRGEKKLGEKFRI